MQWLLNVSDSHGTLGWQRESVGLQSAERIHALAHQVPAPSSVREPGFRKMLSQASEGVSAAQQEIQRNIRTPMSLRDTSALSALLRSISDFLATESVATALGCPVSGQEIADTGYRLLDLANEYYMLAQHFYSDEVRAARASRSSDAADAEIAAVACKAASLKREVMKYLEKAGEAMREGVTLSR